MLFRSGLRPEDIRSVDDLARLPMLSKDTVRQQLYLDLLSENHDKKAILKVTTSGSTGEPFTCFVDRRQLEMRWASTLRGLEWTGYRFGDRHVRLWHQTIGLSPLQVARERLDAWLSRRLFIPAFEMSEPTLAGVLRRIRAYRPVLVDGYAESLMLLAQFRASQAIDGPRPRAVMSSAQVLPADARAEVEAAFACRVLDRKSTRLNSSHT